MPHSSGGSSGSSHSSHSSSHSGSSSSGSISRNYVPGATQYCYTTRGGKSVYYYVTGTPEKTPLLFVLIVVAVCVFCLFRMLQADFVFVPEKLDTASYYSGVTVNDRTGVMDTAALEEAMQEFLDATGVSPAVEFVYEDEVSGGLESYAYNRYLSLFDDEKHWLIELSVPVDFRGKTWPGLQWEGMIGDECYLSVSTQTEETFTKTVNKHLLLADGQNIEQKLADAWSEMAVRATRTQLNKTAVFVVAFFFLFWGFFAWVLIRSYVRFRRLKKAAMVSETAETPVTALSPEASAAGFSFRRARCGYCGTKYNPKKDERCPGCGAWITK